MNNRLYRSKTDRVIAGVCGGIAQHLNIDPIIIRILFLIAFLTEGFGLLLYIILWIAIPEENIVYEEKKREEEKKNGVKKEAAGLHRKVVSDTKSEKVK
jgi:phage shock protein C